MGKMHCFSTEGTHAMLASKMSYKVTSSMIMNGRYQCCLIKPARSGSRPHLKNMTNVGNM